MAEDRFDAIIVGGGLAGSAAAYRLAKEGLEVLVVEKGSSCGCKNMTGGRIYTHSLEKLIPDFLEHAPLERRITKDRFTYQVSGEIKTVEREVPLLSEEGMQSYSVLRAEFDKWLAEKAEEEGSMYICGIRVDNLLIKDGRVSGIIAGEEEMEADVVILADGVNSLLAQKANLKEELKPDQVEVGIKEVFKLDASVMEAHFGLEAEEGLSWICQGEPVFGHKGTGFLYTNRDTVSLGVLMKVSDVDSSDMSTVEMMDAFSESEIIKPYLEGAKLVEYSAHLLPKEGTGRMTKIYGDGVLVAGDAAAMVINLGYIVRGMDLAVESGILAAETVIYARGKEDFSAETLCSYEDRVKQSFIENDRKNMMEKNPELCTVFEG